MAEFEKFQECEDRLRIYCKKNGLAYLFDGSKYPITLTVEQSEFDENQTSLLEPEKSELDFQESKLTISYDCEMEIVYEFEGSPVVSDAILSKLKLHFKSMYESWVRYFHRNVVETKQQ